MILRNQFRFVLEMLKQDGSPLGQVPLACDWEPALECARFGALRRFQLAAIGTDTAAEIRPVWDGKRGQPYVGAIEVALTVPGAGDVVSRVPTTYFKSVAREASAPFVQKGTLRSGEAFDYLVTAFATGATSAERPRARFSIEEVPVPLHLKLSRLSDFEAESVPCGPQDEQDIRVFIPQTVLDEVAALTREAGAVEVASVLIGHNHRDRATGDLFLEVTAQIPARHSLASAVKVTFTPETWTAVTGLINLRRSDEQMIGWFHSHPARHWCNAKCPPEARERCPLQRTFFSADDCDVQRTVFSRANSVALLVTNTDAGLQHAAFAWRNGVIEQRGFHIIQNQNSPHPATAPAEVTAATIGEPEHEKNCPD